MLKKISFLFILFPLLIQAQQYPNWNGYFSYNNIVDMYYSNGKIYAAAENSLFIYDVASQEYTKKTTLDGLSSEEISTIYYSENYQKTIIGYKNGLLNIISDDTDEAILKVVDIVNKTNIPGNNKAVNHIYEHNNLLYLSCDYGISVYNIEYLVFGDTFYIGPGGSQIKINETTILNNEIFVATQSNGILKADSTNPFLIDYNNWTTVQGGSWQGIATSNNNVLAIAYSSLFKYNGAVFALENSFSSGVKSLQVSGNTITVSLHTEAFVFDENFNQIHHQGYTTVYDDFSINTAISIGTDLYLASNKYGLLKSESTDSNVLREIHPDGPLENEIFGVTAAANQFWVVFGDYTVYYNPYPVKSSGISHYIDSTWIQHKYDDFQMRNLVKPTINPNNPNEVYISSYKDGILQITDETNYSIFNALNSPLQDITQIPLEIRSGTGVFDADGLFWTTTGLVEQVLYSYNLTTDTWQDYSVADIIPNGANADYSKIVIDKNNTKWLGTPYHGVIAYDTTGNQIRNIDDNTGGLPNIDVRALAIDHNDILWIGTQTGLVILRNTTSFFTDDAPAARPIVILDDGIPKLLLDQQWISAIEVDGSNNKWFATQDAGVFYTNETGKEIIYHFTKDNSPLPTNSVDDIAINNDTGEVFFATNKGLVSFNSSATGARANLDDVYVYPNPVRPNYTGLVTIKNLIADANVKITDITGNLVYEAVSEGGTLEWDLRAFGTHRVASGVYLIHIISQDATESKLIKLMVIN